MPESNINNAIRSLSSVNNLGFTQFTSNLIQGVFSTIVDSSIKQMEAYASLVATVSKSLSEFTTEVLGENNANAIVFIKEDLGLAIPAGANPTLTLNESQFATVTNTLANITVANKPVSDATNLTALTGTPKGSTITLNKLQPFVVELLTKQAETKYNMLRTLIQLGMQKVVVDKGHIKTKLTFSIDASTRDSSSSRSRDTSSSFNLVALGIGGGVGASGGTGGGGLGGGILAVASESKVSVNVVNERSSAATNLSADIIGEVLIQFRTDSFPIANL